MLKLITLSYLTFVQLLGTISAEDLFTIEFIWDVNETDILHTANNEPIESPVYRTYNDSVEQLWYLKLYPHGWSTNRDFFSLYLCYQGSTNAKDAIQLTGTKPQRELFLLKQESKKYSKGLTSEVIHQCYGDHQFIPRDIVLDRKNGYFVGDKVKIGARIESDPVVTNDLNSNYGFKDSFWEVNIEGKTGKKIFEFSTYNHSFVQRWRLEVYPNGYPRRFQNFFSIALCYSGNGVVEVQYELYLLHHVSQKNSGGLTTETFTFNECSSLPYMIPRDIILNSTNGYFFSNNIKFGVRIQTNVTGATESVLTKKPNYVFEDFMWDLKENDVRNASTLIEVLPQFKTYNHSVEQMWQLELHLQRNSLDGDYLSTDLCYYGENEVEVQYDVYLVHHRFEQYSSGLTSGIFQGGKCAHLSNFISRDIVFNVTYGYLTGNNIKIGLRIQSDKLS